MKPFWLIERGTPPLWWAGSDRWVSDVNEVPSKYRFPTIHLAQATILVEKEVREGDYEHRNWTGCRATAHSMIE
jgi:hypothetical protein